MAPRKHSVTESLRFAEELGVEGEPGTLRELLRVLVDSQEDFVLMGAHAITPYTGVVRATKDIDIVAKKAKQIASAVKVRFPDVVIDEKPESIRITRAGEEFLDIKPKGANEFYSQALKNWKTAKVMGFELKIPSLEMALAAKFAAMISPYRDDAKRFQDAADLTRMIKHNVALDLKKVSHLADSVYTGGGEEIAKHIADVRAGKRLQF